MEIKQNTHKGRRLQGKINYYRLWSIHSIEKLQHDTLVLLHGFISLKVVGNNIPRPLTLHLHVK